MQVRHVAFNPTYGSIQTICQKQEEDGFILSHIVTYHQFESIAVFTKDEDL